MTLASGSRLGAYEVVGLLGAGDMGEVYQAPGNERARGVGTVYVHGQNRNTKA